MRVGVLAVESWKPSLKIDESVRGLFDYLDSTGTVRPLYWPVTSSSQLVELLLKWADTSLLWKTYPIAYVGVHGEAGQLLVGDEWITLTDLAEELEGRLYGRSLYFDSCSVMAASSDEVKFFLDTTGAVAIAGYAEDVAWYESAAFALLLFEALKNSRGDLQAAEAWLADLYTPMMSRLGFRVAAS